MTEKEKQILKTWLVNEDARLDQEVRDLQNRVRFRNISVVDCIELATAIDYYESFKEFRMIIDRLLHLVGD